jgi:iron complex outermembrane receptor protein
VIRNLVSPLRGAFLLLAASLPLAAAEDTSELEALLATPVYAASKYQQSLADAPAAVTVLTQGEIHAFGWRTLADILSGVRGVYQRYDRAYSYIGVRGLSRPGDYSSRLLLLIDGVRVNDNIYDSVLAGREFPLDVELIERVEFIPGPGSAVYGSNAILGTINLVTRSAASLRGNQLNLAVDSQEGRKLALSTSREFVRGTLLLAGSFEDRPGETLRFPEFDSPATPGGVARGLDAETAAKFYGRYAAGDFSVNALVSRRTKEVPNAPFGLVFGDPLAEWVDALALLDFGWHPQKTDGAGWFAQTGFGQYDYHDHGRYEPDGEAIRYSNIGTWWHGELNRTLRLGSRQLLLAGVDAQRQIRQVLRGKVYEPVPEPADTVRTNGTRLGVFVNDEIQLAPGWKLDLGVRADRTATGDWLHSPRAALLWKRDERFVAKLLVGEAFREPNIYERAPADLGATNGQGIDWNDALRRERVLSKELALDWQATTRLRLSGSLFRNDVRAMIEQVVDPDTGELQYANVGSARAEGVELEAEYVAEAGWRVRSSAVRQHVTLNDGRPITNSPRGLYKLHATTPLFSTAARIALELQGMGSRLTESGARLDAHVLTNVSLTWDPPGRRWSVSASLYNLLDERTFDPTGTEYSGDRVEQDGRVATLRVHLAF